MKIWLNDCLVDQLVLPPTGGGWLLGDGIFESLRTYNGTPFALDRHIERLNRSAEKMKISAPSREQIENGVREVIRANSAIPFGRLRITLLSDAQHIITHVAFTEDQSFIALGRHEFAISSRISTSGLKTISYAENSLALRSARERGYDDVILVNERGEVMESALANLIWLSDGQWWTPSLESGCLPGVTRGLLVENFGVQEGTLLEKDLPKVSALAITSSVREIVGVERYEGNFYSHSQEVRELQDSFSAWILGKLAL
jgi:branched-subunit amino acid aminotransferase/4-amino-4-deoxychorismate lyase